MNERQEEGYIGIDAAAEYLDIKPVTLRGWIKNNTNNLPVHRIGKLWKFKKSELDEWIESGKSSK